MTAIRNPTEFFEGAGYDSDDDCQSTGVAHTPLSAPWRGDSHEQVKTRLFRYVRNTPQGTPIAKVLSDVLGDDGDDAEICARTARRFFERHSDLFKTDSRGDMTWVQPRLECYTSLSPLRLQYARPTTSVRDGDDAKLAPNSSKTESVDEIATETVPKYAKERTQSYLDNYLMVESESVKESLLSQLLTDKAGTEDLFKILRRIRGSGRDYNLMKYRTRFNDTGRAGNSKETLETALDKAGNRYNRGVMLTLTTDAKRHSGLSDATESLSDNKARLIKWLATEYQLGYRPANLTALEFTESGLPHYHFVLFGVAKSELSKSDIKDKWESYGQGKEVELDEVQSARNGTQWRLHDDDAGTVTLDQYLGKAIRGLQSIAESDAEELRERVDKGDISLWQHALYWATERRYVTCSPSLRESDDDGSPPAIKKWEFVGVARAEDIPAHVWQSAQFGVG